MPSTLTCKQVLISSAPFAEDQPGGDRRPWAVRPQWPCRWVRHPAGHETDRVYAFRCRFQLPADRTPRPLRLHVTADSRYRLFLDGQAVGDGPQIGDRAHWAFETYEFALEPGDGGPHTLVAWVWTASDPPGGVISVTSGLLVAPDESALLDAIGTGRAAWEARPIAGIGFHNTGMPRGRDMGTGANQTFDLRRIPPAVITGDDTDDETGDGPGWVAAEAMHAGNRGHHMLAHAPIHLLRPAELPPMQRRPIFGMRVRHVDDAATPYQPIDPRHDRPDDHARWQAWCDGSPLTLPAHHSRRVVIDLGRYHAYEVSLRARGGAGARLVLSYAEALVDHNGRKGHREELAGKHMPAVQDCFVLDGGARRYEPLWWRAGRYLQLLVTTAEKPCRLDPPKLQSRGYPLSAVGRFACDEPALQRLAHTAERTVRLCMHETFMDCPFWEQKQFVGDTRLQALVGYVLSADARLARKAIRLFDSGRANPTQMSPGSWPTPVGKLITPFALWWVSLVHDYALWVGDAPFVRARMAGVFTVLDAFLRRRGADGLVRSPPGWTFIDATFPGQVPPGGEAGGTCIPLNWLLVLSLRRAARVWGWLGEDELDRWAQRLADGLASRLRAVAWQRSRGMFADDPLRRRDSVHTQTLAVLAGEDAGDALRHALDAPEAVPASIWFLHDVSEALARIGAHDRLPAVWSRWREAMLQGLSTTSERFGPEPRSDCHGWGGHPRYHLATKVLGVTPLQMGFELARITPWLGPLNRASGLVAHRLGPIRVALRRRQGQVHARIDLPEGLPARLRTPAHDQLIHGQWRGRWREPSPCRCIRSQRNPRN